MKIGRKSCLCTEPWEAQETCLPVRAGFFYLLEIGAGSPPAQDAKQEAVPAIEHIEQMCESMH